MTDRLRADPEFIRVLKAKAALCGMSVKEYTRDLAMKDLTPSLPLNQTYKLGVGANDEKKPFKFKI